MGDDRTKPFLTIRYVAKDDTFAVIDTARHGKVVQGSFKTSGEAQRFAEELYAARGITEGSFFGAWEAFQPGSQTNSSRCFDRGKRW